MRLNYCQYLLQTSQPDQEIEPILPFTELDFWSNTSPRNPQRISLSPGHEVRIVREPFYVKEQERQVKQNDEDGKKTNVDIVYHLKTGIKIIP